MPYLDLEKKRNVDEMHQHIYSNTVIGVSTETRFVPDQAVDRDIQLHHANSLPTPASIACIFAGHSINIATKTSTTKREMMIKLFGVTKASCSRIAVIQDYMEAGTNTTF